MDELYPAIGPYERGMLDVGDGNLVIASVTTTRRSEIDWLYRGVRRFSRSSGSGSWREHRTPRATEISSRGWTSAVPLGTAWDLSRAWPGSELIVSEDAGHLGTAASRDQEIRALDQLAQ